MGASWNDYSAPWLVSFLACSQVEATLVRQARKCETTLVRHRSIPDSTDSCQTPRTLTRASHGEISYDIDDICLREPGLVMRIEIENESLKGAESERHESWPAKCPCAHVRSDAQTAFGGFHYLLSQFPSFPSSREATRHASCPAAITVTFEHLGTWPACQSAKRISACAHHRSFSHLPTRAMHAIQRLSKGPRVSPLSFIGDTG